MYKINNRVVYDLNNIACGQCGMASNYQIWTYPPSGEQKEQKVIKLFCDHCGHKEPMTVLLTHIPNPDAPWRKTFRTKGE